MPFRAFNPTTGTLLREVAPLDNSARETLLARVHAEQHVWRAASLLERAHFVHALATTLRAHHEVLAAELTLEMGKPIGAARAEVEKCALLCDVAPNMAERALRMDECFCKASL